ncbi:hypothetical protein ACOMHN_034147 [Nucella lapillus]
MAHREKVLSLYRQLFRLARHWQSSSSEATDTQEERTYIREEAHRLFRKNKQVSALHVVVAVFFKINCVGALRNKGWAELGFVLSCLGRSRRWVEYHPTHLEMLNLPGMLVGSGLHELARDKYVHHRLLEVFPTTASQVSSRRGEPVHEQSVVVLHLELDPHQLIPEGGAAPRRATTEDRLLRHIGCSHTR